MLVLLVAISTFLGSTLGAPQESINVRIAGGTETDISNYPYALQLHYLDRLECGGVLLSNRYALTAGHCLYNRYMEYFVVRAGTTTLGEGGQTFTISQITFHPNFEFSDDHYDAALLLLSDTVSISSASFAQLAADDSAIKEGATIIVVGWGWIELNNDDEDSPTLRYTDLTILSDEQCKSSYDTPVMIDAMFCANYTGSVVKDFCYGDYGGPAVMDGIVQGIISFGESCADGYHAQVFVRVSMIREWVEGIINAT